jgi:hypothetical protein
VNVSVKYFKETNQVNDKLLMKNEKRFLIIIEKFIKIIE